MKTDEHSYSNIQLYSLVTLRLLIGWHFLYEGLAKISNPYWSSASYLNQSQGFLSEFFISIALNPLLLSITDFINQWGLVAIGLSMMLGIFSSYAKISAMFLLLLYYLAIPPFIGLKYDIPFEGSYMIVNKTLIELAAVFVMLVFPTSKIIGLDRIRTVVTKNKGT